MTDLLTEALEYARRGWYVFPCREKPSEPYVRDGVMVTSPEKTPYVSKGLNDATRDEDQIRAWWNMWNNALIAVNAGMSGLFVIDIDKKHVNGLDTYSKWDINDSAGLRSITPSGGTHIIFTGTGKSSTNGKTGIDTRGEGGYFIAPPSRIIEGENIGEYRRFNDWSKTPGVIPDGLMKHLFPDTTVEYVRGTAPVNGEKKKLSRKTLEFMVEGAEEGERNTKLFNAAAEMAGCGYTKNETSETLAVICNRMGLSNSEFVQVINHAYSKPRTPSIPDSIQEKIMTEGKNVAGKITFEEQAIMENAVLASMMIDNDTIPMIQDILEYEDFRVVQNRNIYKTINTMHAEGMKVDHLTVASEVQKESRNITLDDISRLTDSYFVNADNAITYANIIKEKAYLRKLEALLNNKNKYIKGNLSESVSVLEKDVADIALYGGAKSTSVLSGKQAMDMVYQRTMDIINGKIQLLKTGFIEYDKHVGGIYSNALVICAGRAGEGKSALGLSIANNIALVQNKAVLMFVLEMSTHETICRLITQMTGIPYKDVYTGNLNDEEWVKYKEAKDRISDSKLLFDDGWGMTIAQIRAKIRKHLDKKIEFIVIDQLEQIGGYAGLPLYVRFDRIAYDIKNMAKEFNIPIFLNHQMNRNVTDRRLKNPEPQLSDLNQAGEKPADEVWIISHKRNEAGVIERSKIKMLKNRNGPKIEWATIFVADRMLFSNPVREEDKYVFHSSDDEDGYYGNTYQDTVNKAHSNKPFWQNN